MIWEMFHFQTSLDSVSMLSIDLHQCCELYIHAMQFYAED